MAHLFLVLVLFTFYTQDVQNLNVKIRRQKVKSLCHKLRQGNNRNQINHYDEQSSFAESRPVSSECDIQTLISCCRLEVRQLKAGNADANRLVPNV
jgi:hypothetical protein